MDLSQFTDQQLSQLVNNRWASSSKIWESVDRIYKRNTAMYDMEYYERDRVPEYIQKTVYRQHRVRSNRIFTNTEAVINSLIANPPKPTLIPNRNTPQSIELAQLQEQYFVNKYDELNCKEVLRKGLRNLYFGRLIVLKPFWNAKTNDFDVVSLDPRKIRVAKYATKEVETEFVIEEVTDNLESVMLKFPEKADALRQKSGVSVDQVALMNPEITYREAWIKDRVIFVYQELVLGNIRNPYWDWDGLLITQEESNQITSLQDKDPMQRKQLMQNVRAQQPQRQQEIQQQGQVAPEQAGQPQIGQSQQQLQEMTPNQTEPQTYQAYKFNHFDVPRKPYIFATILNNENTPIGRTDFISEASPLQESLDRRKRQLDENAEMMNGWLKVDSEVMSKEDAQKLRYDVTGIVWGKSVKNGVTRETGVALPNFIFDDMVDSRQEIDAIMAASSAFKGVREGQETKAGRLALIDQSFLRLNELVQVVDYCSRELFNWFYQLAKIRYTETHYAKTMGDQGAVKILELQQDDFEDGTEVRVIGGKTLPEDKEFKYERAQNDVKNGIISPLDYFRESGYNNPIEVAKNAVVYKLNPSKAVGLSDQEIQQIQPQPAADPPSITIKYEDLPIDGQIQAAAKAGIQLDPKLIAAKELHTVQQEQQDKQNNVDLKREQMQTKNNPNVPAKK